jgi:hypothetical protein
MMGVYGPRDTTVAHLAIHIVESMTDFLAHFDWRRPFEAWRFGRRKQIPAIGWSIRE